MTSQFWNICTLDETWGTIYNNLTATVSTELICFQYTWALWIPCSVVLISAVLSCACARRRFKGCEPLPWKPLIISKLMIGATLVILGIIRISFSFIATKQWNLDGISAAVLSITWALLLFLMVGCRFQGTASSGVIFVAWISLAFLSLIRLWTDSLALHAERMYFNFIFVSKMTCAILVTLESLLHCWADTVRIQDDRMWPEMYASFLNKITFHWLSNLVWAGWKRPLEQFDLWGLDLQRRAEFRANQWEGFWQPVFEQYVRMQPTSAKWLANSGHIESVKERITRKKPSVIYRLFLCTKDIWLPAILCKFAADVLLFLNPFLLKKLIAFVKLNAEQRSLTVGIFYALSLLGTAVLVSALNGRFFYGCYFTSMQWKSILTSAMYKKVLRMSNPERKRWDAGKITNVMFIDVSRLTDTVIQLSQVLSTPVVIIISTYLLWWEFGPSLFAGVLVMVLFVPTNGFIASRVMRAEVDQMREKDSRMKLTSELIEEIKVLKLYAWEDHFEKRLLEFRSRESKTLRRIAVWNALSAALLQTVPFLIAALSFTAYVLSHGQGYLTAEKAFVSLALFNILRGPMLSLSSSISRAIEVSVSYRRIKDLLCVEEMQYTSAPQLQQVDRGDYDILLEGASFSWDNADTETVALNAVDLEVSKGSLMAVTGQVGSGKSSLLSAISGELTLLSGVLNVRGSLGVVSQAAWIQNRTIRDNILFGARYDKNRYDQALDACALHLDLHQMPAGDLTEIGERGVTLSGGQKQRIALARAVYQDADVYLLDDPLSALDAGVARHIFINVISNSGILGKKTRLFVTHHQRFLSECDEIIVLRNGQVFTDGVQKDFIPVESERGERDSVAEAEYFPLLNSGSIPMKGSADKPGNLGEAKQGALVEQETARAGATPWYVYKSCTMAMGLALTFLLLFFYLVSEGFGVGGNVWLKYWVDGNREMNSTGDGTGLRLEIYLVLGAFQGFSYFWAAFLTAVACVRAASTLHARLLRHLLRSPLLFFETTPTGRIMNRFSMDLDAVDYSMPMSLRMFMQSFMGVLGVVVVICSTTPWFLIVAIGMGVGYTFFQRYSMHASRQLKRMEAITRSPVYVHFVEAIHGYRFIRSFGAFDRFVSDCYARVDAASRAYYVSMCFTRWLSLRLEVASGFIVFLASLFIVLSKTVSPGSAALSITYAVTINTLLQQVIRYAAIMENLFVAIERICDYSSGEEEAWSSRLTGDTYPASWPETGTVQFKGYQLSYQNSSQAALKNINLLIPDSEKMGIVGRTGAGKSSLLLAMLRIVEPTQGTLFIDSVNVQMIRLKDLRSRVTIIPQDAVVFSGTFRMNLDPAGEYTDVEIWSALAEAALDTYVASMPGKLSYMVPEGGNEMSIGQKHLLCLARALLRKSKILLLDEATSAVDVETEAFILRTVRDRFASSTVVTVAHRLSTVMNSSRVVVMADGEVLECDTPEKLKSDPQSAFYDMCKQEKTV